MRSFLLFLSCLASGLLSAQTDTLPLSTTAEPVEITAGKFPRPAKASPRDVTVIDSARIARAAAGDLAQLLQEELGVVMTGAYTNPGQNKAISLRGATSEYTLLLIDGVPVTDPSAIGSVLDLRLISLDQLERIEILRGPASLLYGADATAGVVNLITKRGRAGGGSGELRLSYGSLNTRQAALAIRNGGKRADFQASYDRYETDGISEAARPEGSTADFDRDGMTRENFSAALTLRAGDHLTVRPSLRLAGFSGDFDSGAFQDGDPTYENSLVQPALAVDYGRKDVALAFRYSRALSERSFRYAFSDFDYSGRSTVADLYGSYRFGKQTDLLLGVQSRREETLTAVEENVNFEAVSLSPYAQFRYQPVERLVAEAGLRYNSHSEYGGQFNYSLATRYALTGALAARLSIATGHQNPTLDQLFGPFGANPELSPQVVTSGELGLELAPESATYGATFSLFRRRTTDIITYDFSLGYRNETALRDWGFELGGHYRPLAALRLETGLSYTQGLLTVPDGRGGTTEQEGFLRRPALKWTGAATYEFAWGGLLRLSALHVGARTDQYFDADFNAVPADLDAYWLAHLYVEQRLLRGDRLRVFLDVRNLLGTEFVELAGFSALGRTLQFGVGYAL